MGMVITAWHQISKFSPPMPLIPKKLTAQPFPQNGEKNNRDLISLLFLIVELNYIPVSKDIVMVHCLAVELSGPPYLSGPKVVSDILVNGMSQV